MCSLFLISNNSQVLESDAFYPKVICKGCFNCIEKTIEFFEKIVEGQRLLASILNCLKMEKAAKNEGSTISRENPLRKKSKRRGRPRKPEDACDEMSVISTSSTTKMQNDERECTEKIPAEAQPPEIIERRTKRQSRPPVRYVDEVLPNTFRNDVIAEQIQGQGSQRGTSFVLSNNVCFLLRIFSFWMLPHEQNNVIIS